MTEIPAQQAIRLAAPGVGVAMWRNNSGALQDKGGRTVRFGLGNDSAKLNKVFKSSDLIGILPVTIRPEHVGMTVGVFLAVEVKDEKAWRGQASGEHQQAQENFLRTVRNLGGVGFFATSATDFEKEVRKWR
jgi:hypothetical protein